MEQILLEMFEQARKLVVETDRRLAEGNDRIREKEREAKLLELSSQIEAAFDFTSKEKLELDPRLDIQEGSLRWNLSCEVSGRFSCCRRSQRGLEPERPGRRASAAIPGRIKGGTKGDAASRRLAAARIVTAIGNGRKRGRRAAKKPVQSEQPRRWQDSAVPLE